MRVFEVPGVGEAFIVSDGHPPPHVHFVHRGEGWTVKVRFSFLSDAVAADAELARSELRAEAVTFDEVVARLSFTLRGGLVIGVPRASIEALSMLAGADMLGLRLGADGVLLEIPGRDVHLHVPRLLARVIEGFVPSAVLRFMFARTGGAARSEKKRLAAVANGKRGGRKPKQAA